MSTVLAVDGGGSKTDVALVRDDGALLGFARGPLSHPHHIGVERSAELVAALAVEAGAPADLAVVQEIERSLLDLYRDPTVDERPDLLMQRGGAYYSEAALGLISSLATDDGAIHEVDVRNEGTLDGLADDDVVEAPAHVGPNGPEPLPQPPLAPELLGLVQHVAAYERLTVRAALSRDPVDARKALLAHPLIGQVELVDGLLDQLVAEAVH